MAKVAQKYLIWQSDPTVDEEGRLVMRSTPGMVEEAEVLRVETNIDEVVPDTVPEAVQEEWLAKGWVIEDPTKARIPKSEGPPRMLLPVKTFQQVAASRTAPPQPVRGRVPPRPTSTGGING